MKIKLKSRRLPTSDIAEPLITVTDIKHFLYCPKIVFFEYVLHAKPMLGSQQKESSELHEEYVKKEVRRKGAIYYSPEFKDAEKRFFVNLCSPVLNLKGTIDLLIKTGREYIPIEYKNTLSNKGRPWTDHKYQLVAYALLIDENYKTKVKRGYINYIPEEKIIKIDITPTMKTYIKRIISRIIKIISEEKMPKINVAKNKCTGGCGFKYICFI